MIADHQSENAAINALKFGAYYLISKPINQEVFSALLKNINNLLELNLELLNLKENGFNHQTDSYTQAMIIGSDRTLSSVEKVHITRVLNENRWNISRSALKLGIDRVTLYNKIKKYSLRNAVN